ncbi:MAG: segregation/condensation protein A [Christensenellaceae bacterium]|jgi:segregation and condensation protein A|nr:segregation/condensation protein A [Christensenellaceae bacterium]
MALIERAGENIKVHLTDFDGPIDLLLHLIREQKLDIKTVKLGEMTKQYLAYLTGLGKLDLDLASEFIEVGATLVEIKCRQILPKPIVEMEESDSEELLRQRLEEYNLFLSVTGKLKNLEDTNRFYRSPAPVKSTTAWTLNGVTMDDFTEILGKMLLRVGENAIKIEKTTIQLDRFTVKDKIKDVVCRLQIADSLRFTELFEPDMTRSELINTFLAILELLRTQIITVWQTADFDEIEIKKGGSFDKSNNTDFANGFGIAEADADYE